EREETGCHGRLRRAMSRTSATAPRPRRSAHERLPSSIHRKERALMARIDENGDQRRSLLRFAAGSCLALSLAACKQTDPAPAASGGPASGDESAPAASSAPPSPSPAAASPGTVRVVSANADALQRPTTAAFRGQTLWVSIGQLGALFTDGARAQRPCSALSLSLAGEPGASVARTGPDYYPEGIAAAADGTLYVGSIMQGVISKVPAGSTTAEPFVKKGGAKR